MIKFATAVQISGFKIVANDESEIAPFYLVVNILSDISSNFIELIPNRISTAMILSCLRAE